MLLHGFPEFWYGWRHQLLTLAAAGYHVVAPDGRGYNLSEKPAGVEHYRLDILVSDVVALYEHLGRNPVDLVGHDWGAAVAWATAALHPEKVRHLAVLNVPHPSVMRTFLLRSPQQVMRSCYMFVFQIRRLPEWLVSVRQFALLRRALVMTSMPGTFSEKDLIEYRAAWSQAGAMAGMINWYRALLSHGAAIEIPDIKVRTLILWGKRDIFLMSRLAELSLSRCANGELVWLEQASHWIQHEQSKTVNTYLLRFFDQAEKLA